MLPYYCLCPLSLPRCAAADAAVRLAVLCGLHWGLQCEQGHAQQHGRRIVSWWRMSVGPERKQDFIYLNADCACHCLKQGQRSHGAASHL